jgi:hypothetical protein
MPKTTPIPLPLYVEHLCVHAHWTLRGRLRHETAMPNATQLATRATTSRNDERWQPETAITFNELLGKALLLEIPPTTVGRGKRYRPAAIVAEIPTQDIDELAARLASIEPPFPEPYLTITRINAQPWTAEGRRLWASTSVIVIHRSDDLFKVQQGINYFYNSVREHARVTAGAA